MYYRQKIQISLIESFGGSLQSTDFIKYLLIFCQDTGRNYYDFFPYKYGGFSFLAYQDKAYLTKSGFLHNSDDFQCSTSQSFLNELKPKDQTSLGNLSKSSKLNGKELIRKTYLSYPHYTCRSEILSEILDQDEINRVQLSWNTDVSPVIFTLGYEGISLDSYLSKLIFNNVRMLIDVRINPHSMKYGFSKKTLRSYLDKVGIEYIHIPGLGIPGELRKSLDSAEDYQKLFQLYQHEILPKQEESIEILRNQISQNHRVALTCFEAKPHLCHRHKITEYLDSLPNFGTKIVHL